MCTHVGVAGHVAEIFTVAGHFSDFLLPNSVNFYDFAESKPKRFLDRFSVRNTLYNECINYTRPKTILSVQRTIILYINFIYCHA